MVTLRSSAGTVDALLDEQFGKLLTSLDIREAFEDGQFKCFICGDGINHTNVKAAFPVSETHEVGFLCNKPECLMEFALTER